MSGANVGERAEKYTSSASRGYQVAYGTLLNGLTAPGLGKPKLYVDGDDALLMAFLLVPDGACTVAIERSLDDGTTWLPITGLALVGAAAIEVVELHPIGLYRAHASVVGASCTVLFRKKVRIL